MNVKLLTGLLGGLLTICNVGVCEEPLLLSETVLPIGPSDDDSSQMNSVDTVEYSPDGRRIWFGQRTNRRFDKGYLWHKSEQNFTEYVSSSRSANERTPFVQDHPQRRARVNLESGRGRSTFRLVILLDEGFVAMAQNGAQGVVYHVDDRLQPTRRVKPLSIPLEALSYYDISKHPGYGDHSPRFLLETIMNGQAQALVVDAGHLQQVISWSYVKKGSGLTDPEVLVLGKNQPIAAMVFSRGLQFITSTGRATEKGQVVSFAFPAEYESQQHLGEALFLNQDRWFAHVVKRFPDQFSGVRIVDVANGEEVGRIPWNRSIHELQTNLAGDTLAIMGSDSSGIFDLDGESWQPRLTTEQATQYHRQVVYEGTRRLSPDGSEVACVTRGGNKVRNCLVITLPPRVGSRPE